MVSLESLGAFGLPPNALARIAAERDCRLISTRPAPIGSNPEGLPAWSLRDDPQRRSCVEGARVVLAQAG